jgi:hypothetical protein
MHPPPPANGHEKGSNTGTMSRYDDDDDDDDDNLHHRHHRHHGRR